MKYGQTWDHIHKVIDDEVGCEECNVHGHFEIDGLRDHIAAGIGKTVYNKKKYNEWYNEVVCTHNKCKAEGRC